MVYTSCISLSILKCLYIVHITPPLLVYWYPVYALMYREGNFCRPMCFCTFVVWSSEHFLSGNSWYTGKNLKTMKNFLRSWSFSKGRFLFLNRQVYARYEISNNRNTERPMFIPLILRHLVHIKRQGPSSLVTISWWQGLGVNGESLISWMTTFESDQK